MLGSNLKKHLDPLPQDLLKAIRSTVRGMATKSVMEQLVAIEAEHENLLKLYKTDLARRGLFAAIQAEQIKTAKRSRNGRGNDRHPLLPGFEELANEWINNESGESIPLAHGTLAQVKAGLAEFEHHAKAKVKKYRALIRLMERYEAKFPGITADEAIRRAHGQ